jgi:hypothetical protein
MTHPLFFAVAIFLAQASSVTQQAQNGSATGVIRSATGQSVAGVRVAAQAVPNSEAGAGEGALVSLTQTDSTGRYRLENIPPGRYYIQAGLVDLPTYYPGATTAAAATSILIGGGAVVANLDFTITQSTGVRVSGKVPSAAVRPSLIGMSGGPGGGLRSATAQVKPDSTFEFLKVLPGNYTLQAVPNNGLPILSIVVADKDIEVGVASGPGVRISGVVGLGPRSPRPTGQKVVLSGSSGWAVLEGPIAADGAFTIASVPPGTYTVKTIPGSPASLATVVIADREIAGIAVGAHAELPGRVVFPDGARLPAFSSAPMIEAKPANGAILATAIRTDGTFRFPLSEGEYRITAARLPAGTSLKSISYGSIDLMKDPLKLDGTADIMELTIILEKKP